MPASYHPAALRRHAREAGDRRLERLIARTLADSPESSPRRGGPLPAGARRAYAVLCVRLGLLAERDEHAR